MRAEACRIAARMAAERGGRSSDYMKEAWREVKRDPRFSQHTSGVRRRRKGGKLRTAANYISKKTTEIASNVDFTKAPKDSPRDIFSGIENMITKRPQKVEIPDTVKDDLKRMFRFW